MISLFIAALALGVVSAPHCALMCGPLATYAGCSRRAPGALYHGSRLATLIVGGALAGAFGESVVLRLSAHWGSVALSTFIGVALCLAAARALQLYTRRRRGALSRERSALVTLRVSSAASDAASKQPRGLLRAGGLGALTPLLPCGATWSLWMLAVGSASPLHGALVAAVFFVPTALSVHLSASLASRFAGSANKGYGVFAFVFAFGALVTLLRPVEAFVAYCRP
ncbi:MAG: sulfite exporter TauE/SafE family protein [Polyangiales bacterium]